mgnify:CR=1 FL=1
MAPQRQQEAVWLVEDFWGGWVGCSGAVVA